MGCFLSFFSLSTEAKILRKKVCVIGAGAAGLATVKQLANRLDEFEPIVFEKNSDVGGLWIYSDDTGIDSFGLPVQNRLYSNLRTNLPTELMAFPDYKNVTDGTSSCVSHEVILQYLRNFTDDFNLRQYIQFNTLVEKVLPISTENSEDPRWIVTTRTAKTNKSNEVICDAVMVCNGQFYKPNIPKIPGIESFPGRLFHSAVYRKPEEFKGKTVIILGAGISGPDIAVDISKYAKTIYLSHRRDKLPGKHPSNVIQVAGIISANNSEFTLEDESKITADTFIYCTGYVKEYPFLDKNSGVHLTNREKYVGPLYKYLINTERTSMAFIGVIPSSSLSFPQFYLQAQYYVAVLQGKVKLPNRKAMLKDIDGMESLPRNIFDFEWTCHKEYVKSGYVEPLPSYYQPATKVWLKHLYAERYYYKDYNLRFAKDGRFEICKAESKK